MNWLRAVERRFGRYAIQDLTIGLIAVQILTMIAGVVRPSIYEKLILIPNQVLEGEVWRLLTFLMMPVSINPLQSGVFGIIFLVIYYQIWWFTGGALDRHWGAFRYNMFLLLGYVFNVAAGFLVPYDMVSNFFLAGTVYLAFCLMFPEHEFLLFFAIPVKCKIFAGLIILGAIYALVWESWQVKLSVLASGANVILFFAPEYIERGKAYVRRRKFDAAVKRGEEQRKAAEARDEAEKKLADKGE